MLVYRAVSRRTHVKHDRIVAGNTRRVWYVQLTLPDQPKTTPFSWISLT